jgi:HEAT repeat protein
MSGGLATTFRLLADTANDAASAVLIAALDVRDREIRDQALTALLCRRNDAAEETIVRRWKDLPAHSKSQVAQRGGWLSSAIRKALADSERRFYECGCAAAVGTRDYDLIPVLVGGAMDRTNPNAGLAAATTLELAELLSEEVTGPRDYRVRRDPQLQRHHVLPSLERAATELAEHGHTELLEAFVLLANRENAALKRLLQAPSDRRFQPLADVLANSSRPAAARLLLSYLDDPHAPLSAIQIIGRRSDVSFLRHMARKIGGAPSPTVRANLKRIDSIPWVPAKLTVLDALSEAEQPGAVQLVVASSVARQQAFEVVSYVLSQGKVSGRRAAAEAMAEFGDAQASALAVRTLEDEDPHVRAAIAAQLRARGVPGAINRLVQMLESPHQVECEAAAASLDEFYFDRFSANFESLKPESRGTVAKLVRRVDPNWKVAVKLELEAPTRSRRQRALEMVLALDALDELREAVGALLKDEDQFLRVEAIRALATADGPATRQALRDALVDPHPLVQQAAEAALARLTHSDTTPAAAGRDTVSLSGAKVEAMPAGGATAAAPVAMEAAR